MSALSEWIGRLFPGTPPKDTERHGPEYVLTKHAGRLMQIKGVMSIGIGKDDDGRPAIVIGVSSGTPDAVGQLPDSIEGVPVVKRSS
ncbi:MAG: hypothetical protein LLG08_08755 [Actinomycetia bacterium]|nr:hypothetical protein [Actinomycetes bacterium]